MTKAITLAELADQNTLTVDGSNNRVGIASTIPTVTLDVDGGGIFAGVVTATSFSGTFEGGLTGDATGLTGTPDIAITNITGVAATFTGVLTYEDVTNVDSIGIITARSGINIGPSAGVAGTFAANGSYVTAGIITAADGFTSGTGGPVEISVVGSTLTFNVAGVGSTSLTLA